mmetsp:Transcript_51493/g.164675  ORF Transcript_51493/g.164675 Transcript_51493/m.164675 type:complete len:374 (-) Transcript_51493:1070-2191(-)
MRQPGLLERRRGRPPGRLHLLHGQKDPLLQRQPRGVQRPHQLQRGVTQTPHRLGEAREVQGAAAGRLDAALRLPGPLPPLLVAEDDAEALPHPPVRARRHGGAAQGGRGLAVVGGAQAVLQGGVAGAPHQVALLHPRAVDRSFREAQLDLLHAPGDGLALLRHLSEAPPLGVEKLEDGAALLVLLGQPAIEYHPVPALEGGRHVHDHPALARHAHHLAHERAPVPGRPPPHELLVLHSVHEAHREAAVLRVLPPRENELQLPSLLWAEKPRPAPYTRRLLPGELLPRGVHGAPVDLGGERDVLGALEAPLDLEAAHARTHQLGHPFHRHEILRAQEVLDVPEVPQRAVHQEAVRHAARLRALPPVGAAPAPGL